jgi:hypothetical protein
MKGDAAMKRLWWLGLMTAGVLLFACPGLALAEPTVEVKAPPAGWNPLTASPEELNAYNLPPRPADPAALQRWVDLVTKTQWQPPTFGDGRPREGAGPSFSGGATQIISYNWGGVVTTGTYTAVRGSWRHPFAYADPGPRPALSTQWIGLGGFAPGKPLIQIGTEARVYPDGSGGYDSWYEIVGTSADTGSGRRINFPHRQGDEIYAEVWWTEANGVGTAHFYLADRTLNTSTSFSVPNITGYEGVTSSAEWINEIPTVKGTAYLTLPYYTATETHRIPFWECQAGQVGSLGYIDPHASTTHYVELYRAETPLQGVSAIDRTGRFQTIWYGY